VSAEQPILSRLESGPAILLGSDAITSLQARGVELAGPSSLGRIVRENPGLLAEHYHKQVESGVDVLTALTADTIPRSLAQIGMSFRAAALTGCSVDLALDAADDAGKPMLVAGVLGTNEVTPPPIERIAEELAMHATRLAAAGCELILTRGFDPQTPDPDLLRIARRAAVASATATQLPTWVILELNERGFTSDGESLEDAARAAVGGGVQVVMVSVSSVELGLSLLDRLRASRLRVPLGVELAARASNELGASRGDEAPELWAASAKRLIDAGARVLGGGSGTTDHHVAALSKLLRMGETRPLYPPAV